ncbi:response regulator transcription factor [Jeotgalibacillus haloalkalitolerans]|uniref:Response regulator transcription factor n=1 Tax=Jeotgalibacillus haloalkalitolerans TaxID=3104292 RepID=A0ABU5KJM1_9BACL|nr:response regulator transcription factor [Jeotgalibacillus sp. HH7-29]MDZ5711423.1 response regulator transcription factor [Jeotgalibacillus sp. HH7-29]
MFNVMLVDDEPLILEGLQHIIDWNELGFRIAATAKDGQEGLALASTLPIDLIITDIKMPEMNGLSLLKELNQQHYPAKSIVLSGFQEFDLIKEGLMLGIENYLTKPVDDDELIASLKIVREKLERSMLEEESRLTLRDHAIIRWLTGKMKQEEFDERLTLYSSELVTLPAVAGLLKMDFSDREEGYLYQLQHKIESRTNATAVVTPSADLLLLIRENDLTDEFTSIVEDLLAKTEYVLVFSRLLTARSEFQEVFREMEMTSELTMLTPSHREPETLTVISTVSSHDPQFNIRPEWLEMLADRKADEVTRLLGQKLAETNQGHLLPVTKGFLLELFFSVKNKFMISMDYRDYVQLIHRIMFFEHINEANQLLKDIIDMVHPENPDQEKKSIVIQRVLHYIHESYHEDMSLKTLGHQFHINPIYLGQLFQKEVGAVFTKYLNQIRISKAKALLLNSSEKAGMIGKKVGYTDATYFYKQFKKYEGVTPSEWRKRQT